MGQVITAADIARATEDGDTTFAVPNGAVLTPLAREEAQRLGVRLVYDETGAATDPDTLRPSTQESPGHAESGESRHSETTSSGKPSSVTHSFGVSASVLAAMWPVEESTAAPLLPVETQPRSGNAVVIVQDVVCVPTNAPETAFAQPEATQWSEAFVGVPCLYRDQPALFVPQAHSTRPGGWLGLTDGVEVTRTRFVGHHVDLGERRAGAGFRGSAPGISLTVRTRKRDAPDIIPALALVITGDGPVFVAEERGGDCLSGDAQVELSEPLSSLVPDNKVLGLDYTYTWRAERKEVS